MAKLSNRPIIIVYDVCDSVRHWMDRSTEDALEKIIIIIESFPESSP